MTSITPVAASNGADTTTSERERPRPGLPKLRDMEAKALIHLGLDALSEAANLGHDMHKAIYDTNASTERYAELKEQLTEVLTCLETAEHYLFMLGSVFEDPATTNRPLTAVPSS